MDMGSARGLKAQLLEPPARVSRGGSAGLGTQTFGLGRATQAGAASDQAAFAPPVAIGIAPSRDKQAAKVVLIGTDERHREHPIVERAFRLAPTETVFVLAGVAEPLSHWRPAHRQPLELGVSVGHHGHRPGTLGAFVTMADGAHCMLSANHVLAGVNAGVPDDAIIQPGRDDGGPGGSSVVGALRSFIPLEAEPARNVVDCAVAALAEGVAPTAAFAINEGEEPFRLTGLGGADDLFDGDEVLKFGRTTGRTAGKVLAVEVDNFRVNMGTWAQPRWFRFDNQMHLYSEEGPFAAPGDSGALVVDPEGRAHGLLFAGTQQGGPAGTGIATANVLDVALRALEARLWLQ